MSTKEEKELDDFIRKMVVDAGLEKPAPELKTNIMDSLQKRYSRIIYRSLIPKRGWALIAMSIAVFVGFVVYNPLGIGGFFIDLFPWDVGNLVGDYSSTTVYSVVILGVMMLFQILMIKRRLDHTYRN